MHTTLLTALETLKNQTGLVPDDLIRRFEYCSSNASRHVMREYVFDHLTPERDYRTALLQLYGKMQALVDLYYNESKRARDIERKQLDIQDLKDRLTDVKGTSHRRLELDIADAEEDLLRIEDGRKLTKPLLDDALMEVDFYMGMIQQLEKQGLRPFEEAESDYFRKKALTDAKFEMLSASSGLSRSVVEQLYRQHADTFDALLPANAQSFLTRLEAPAALVPLASVPDVVVLVLRESEHHPLPAPPALTGKAVETLVVPPMGSLHDGRLAALDFAKDYPCPVVLMDGNLLLEPEFLKDLLESPGSLVALAEAPGKYGAPDAVQKVHGFSPSLMFVRPEGRQALVAFLQEMPLQPVPLDVQTVQLASCRIDADTGRYWSLPTDYVHPSLRPAL